MAQADESPGPRPRRVARKLALSLAVLVLALAGCELGTRVWLALRGTPWDGAAARVRLLAAIDAMTQPLPTDPEELGEAALRARSEQVVHPYFGFDTVPGVKGAPSLVQATREGGPDAPYRVLIVGGSVSGMVSKNGAAALAEVLSADPRLGGRRVEVLNQGRGSFKQPQQVMVVAYLLAMGARPDAVVNIDGFNEVALGSENGALGAHPVYPHWPRWGFLTSPAAVSPEGVELAARVQDAREQARRAASRAIDGGLLRSALLGGRALARVNALRLRWVEAQAALVRHVSAGVEDDPAKGPAFAPEPGLALAAVAQAWMESSRNLHGMLRERGVAYLHCLQPTLHDVGSKPLTAKERDNAAAGNPAFVESVARGYPLLRQAGGLLQEQGVPFLDASMLFADYEGELYVDVCHFRKSGCALVGRAIGEALLAQLP